MLKDLTDEKLVELSLEGDADAFGEVVRRWERKIFALCFGMLGREEDARDAAQETFIAAYKALANFRGEAKVSSWLHRIAVNQCLTFKRRAKVRPEDLIGDDDGESERVFVAPEGSSPHRSSEKGQEFALVRQAVGSLPLDLRQVVVMKEFEDMTFQEISDTLDVPLSTVKSRLYTALKQLRMKLERLPVRAS
ncbi:MAG: RNA polymerase sigma factor [Pyrinomonadaceae bacterium]